MIYIPISLAVVFLIYLFMVAPKNREEMNKFKNVMYAHRGLHNKERAENSMSAFRAAVDAGYGIELDIHLSKDGRLVVFHDDTLDRICGREGRVDEFTYDELSRFKLSGTEDGIPLFEDVLKLVNGKVPILVEIKEFTNDSSVSSAACEMLNDYKGEFIVESFNPLALRNVRKKMPQAVRGILSRKYSEPDKSKKILYKLLQSLMLNFVCRPAFIAYDHRNADSFALRFVRRFFGVPTIAWTVHSVEEEKEARKNKFDGIIFEDYLP